MSLLVVGSVAFDAIESPYGKVDRIIGGAATYFAVAASFFTHVNLVAIDEALCMYNNEGAYNDSNQQAE